MLSRRTRRLTLAALLSLSLVGAARAAENTRTLKIAVPFAAGGISDSIARLLANRLTAELGRTVIVDSQPGGSGLIAARRTIAAEPDGTTILNTSPTMMLILPRTQKLEFDPSEVFVPVSNMGSSPLVFGVSKDVPAKTLQEFIDYVKKSPPDTYNYASGGAGTSTHLIAELFFKRAGIKLVHVAYKGGAPALTDLLAGHVQAYFGNPSEFLPHRDGGVIKILATSGATRMAELPDVPVLGETIPGLALETWNGLSFRKGTPVDEVERVSAAVQKISREPEYVASLLKIGVTAIGDTPQHFGDTIKRDRALWNEAVDAAGITQQ
jgi:tripartite-type tricarboxylate transporter receptor subunit TctC